MNKDRETSIDASELRRRAEEQLKLTAGETHPSVSESDALRLIHELLVHEIELNMQNDELGRAKTDIADLLERYTDLYDFAPIGYFLLTASAIFAVLTCLVQACLE